MGHLRATARQLDNLRHDVKVRRHTITSDEPKDHGGEDSGPSPQELLAASLASCTAITMEMYARRKGWNISGLAVEMRLLAASFAGGTEAQFGAEIHVRALPASSGRWSAFTP